MATPLRHVSSRAAQPRTRARPPTLSLVHSTPSWTTWVADVRRSLSPLVTILAGGYGAALAATALATLAALGLGLGAEPGVFAPFLVAVTAVALRYGVGPAILTILASTVAAYAWFLSPLAALAFDPAALRRLALFRLGVFAGAGVLVTLVAATHRRTLLELERQRRQLRAFTTNDEVGLQVIDHDGRIVWADNVTARLLGYAPDEWVGSELARFHADPTLAWTIHARLAAGTVVENVRAALRRKDGTTQDVLLNSNSLLGDARTPGHGVLVAALPCKSPGAAAEGSNLALSALLERRRRTAANRRSENAPS